VSKQSDTVQTLTYAQLCWEEAKTNPIQARQYGQTGLTLAQKIGFARGEVENLHHIGITYGRQANYAEALHYSFKALPIAETLPDKNLLATVLRSIGALLSTQKEYARSIPILTRALRLIEQQTNQFEKPGILYFLAEAQIRLKNYPKGLALMKQSMTLAQTQHQPYDYALALSGFAWGLQEQGRFAKSIGYDQQCLRIMRAEKYTYGIANALNRLSASHYRLGRLPEAEQYGLQALATAHQVGNWNEIKNIEKNLFRIYTATNDDTKADRHFSAFEAAQDSVFGQQRSQAIANVETRYQLKLKDQQIAGLNQKTQLQQYLLWAGVAGGVLLLLVLGLLYNRYQLRDKEKRAIEQQREAEQELSLAQEQKLQLELDLKHRELASSALFAYQKNELLGDLKQQVGELISDVDTVQRPKVTAIQKFIQSNLHFEQDWDAFRAPFEQVHPRFFEKLQRSFPDLTPNEQKLCAYTRINLSNKEIARLLNINTSSVEMSRYRMKKKMALNGCESLTDFIQKL
jgi:DNA-binding CsgD family transcriptional regulator